ncbi:AraC family transcriptional regulator [Sphingobium sp. SA916]|uniref:AraC family transcriptional regulator n=1 Tax=Sphingobium sp. SA916 TaxID=1851207 RepID=UPI0015590B20|nr:AraC family transcriptional regulator [Sphingobium sp. SA916]
MKERRLIRSATLGGYAKAARDAGLDPHEMLAEVGLDPGALLDTDILISLDAFLTLLVNSAKRSGLSDFGIRAAHARGIPDLGMVSLLMREADDVEAALRLYTSHLRLHADGTVVQLDTRFDDPIIIVEIQGNTKQEAFQATLFSVTGIVQQIRWLIGETYRPELVCFAFAEPPDTRLAQNVFQCDVRYNQILSGIVIDRTVLRRPLVTSAPFLRKLALRQLQPLMKHGHDTFAMKVTRLIRQGLEDGEFSSELIAANLAIDRRTLTRRLQHEGATYSSLLQTVRMQIAQQGLENPEQSLTELAVATGFQSLSAFSRWIQASFGCSATDWRANTRRSMSSA